MSRALFLLQWFLVLFSYDSWSVNYYFSSSSGNDNYASWQAQSPSTPWKTLAKLNSIFNTIQPGDSLLFRSGDTFAGSFIIQASGSAGRPIVFSSYGDGTKPVFSGFNRITNWTNVSAGVWESRLPATIQEVNFLLMDGRPMRMGRFPNYNTGATRYLGIQNVPSATQIQNDTLKGSINWTGATAVVRKDRWVIERLPVQSHNGNTITLGGSSAYGPKKNYGFFIQNHPATLDQVGEWAFIPAQNRLLIYTGTRTPFSYSLKITAVESLVTMQDRKYISFINIHFTGAGRNLLLVKNSAFINISNCFFSFSGLNGIAAGSSTDLNVSACDFEHINNIAFDFNQASNIAIRDNYICNTGTLEGMGDNPSGSYSAINITGNNNLIEWNHIDTTGYNAISFRGNNVTIRNNFIKYFCYVKDDGGGIYTWNNERGAAENTGRNISSNIIVDGKGAGMGTDNTARLSASGIYIDDNSANVAITGNAVARCNLYGIYVHNSYKINLRNNTAFNNATQLAVVQDRNATAAGTGGNIISGNILFSLYARQDVCLFKTYKSSFNELGSFNSNIYSRPADDDLVLNVSFEKNNSVVARYMNIPQWAQLTGKDASSSASSFLFNPFTVNSYTSTEKITNGRFRTNTQGVSAYSPDNNIQASWQQFSKLDSGALRISYKSIIGSSRRSSVIVNAGQLVKNQGRSYVLSFSMLGTDVSRSVEIFLRQSLSPYKQISERKRISVKKLRSEQRIVFKDVPEENNSSIVFDVEEQGGELLLDNISLRQALVTFHDPAAFFRFEYNTGKSYKTINLGNSYVDINNKPYPGTLILKPFESAILFRQNNNLVKLTHKPYEQ